MDADLMAMVLKAWNVPAPAICTPLHGIQHVLLLEMPGGARYVLKESDKARRVSTLDREYKVLAHLQAHGVPVALPLLTRERACHAVHGEKLYSLAPHLPAGDCPDEQALFRNYGRAIAKFHRALAAYPEKIDSWRIELSPRVFVEAAGVLRQNLSEDQRRTLFPALSAVEEEMKSAWSNLPEQYIHGDCHGGNLVINGGQVTGFLDCDHLPLGPRIYDLAYLLADRIKNALAAGREACLPMFRPLLGGYMEIEPLVAAEKRAVWHAALGVQVIFTAVFAEQANQELIRKNTNAFFWIYRHKEKILEACEAC